MRLNRIIHMEKYKAYFKNKGLRLTKARLGVLEVLLESDSPMTAFKTLVGLEKRKIRADRATVYRTIEWLLEHEIIRQVYLSGSIRYYELIEPANHHHHIVCTKCRCIIDFTPSFRLEREVKKQIKKSCKECDFEISDHSFELLGTCKKCSKK